LTEIDVAQRLVVHGRRGVTEIPLSGDPRLDALLERFASKGGTVLRQGILVNGGARDVPRDGA